MASQTSTHAARAGAAPRGTAFSFSALRRAVGFMLRHYAAAFAAVVACIIVAALATAQSLLFTQDLIDVYIEPMIATGSTDFSGLASYLVRLGGVLIVGVVAAFAYNRIMVTISQGTMRRLRDELFEHMESLPIRYFDTHPHGDIMSVYTNDVDTLRQLYAQTLPQLVNSCVTLVVTFAAMVALSVPLTVLSLVLVALMVFSTLAISRASAPYFAGQQRSLGEVEGLVEELMDGQKVIKVFCHEGSEQARHAPRQRAAARRYQPRHGHLQPRHARERQHRQHLLRGDGRGGRRHGHRGRGRTYAGRARELCESQAQLHAAHHADLPADELRDAGRGRCRARLRPHGRGAGGGPRLRGARERARAAGRERGALRGAHRRVGVEAPASLRRYRDLRAPARSA